MKRHLILLLCVMTYLASYAATYQYRFSDIPLSTALARISRDHPELKLSFIYDELDKYHTSAHIDTDDGLKAVRQLTFGIPVRVYKSRNGIYVEAMQRGYYRYTGWVTGEGDERVSHATVMILAPKDSTVLTYAFTDNSGRFSIPCDARNVILKLSSVGYMTTYLKASKFNVGEVRMIQAPVTLGNLTVKTEHARIENDKTVFMPGKREKNAAHGGADLLLAMGLPTVRVNPADMSITTNIGEEVQTFIDFLPADKNELSGMRPQDVRYVEVYENPQDPRFNDARYAVNFIMVKYEYGGYTKLDAYQSIPDPSGDFSVNSKFSYKKMTYDVAAGYFYEIDHHSRNESESLYEFPDQNVSWLSSTYDRHYRHAREYATLRAIYSDSLRVVSNTIGYQGNGSHFQRKDNNIYTPEIYPDDISTSGIDFRSNSANWRGNWQFFFPRDISLIIEPTLRYSHHSTSNSYNAAGTDIITNAKENAWFGHISINGCKKWGKQSLTASLFGEFSDNKLHYEGSDLTKVHNYTDAIGVGLSSRLYFGKFWMSPSAKLYYQHRRFDDIKDNLWLPKYFISLGYKINQRHELSIHSEMSHWTIGVAQRSPNIVIRNLFDAITGNPSLRPSLFNSVSASYSWNVCDNLFLNPFCNYRHWTNPVTEVYTPTIINGRQMMLRSLENDGYYSELKYGVSVSANYFNRSLNFWLSVYGDYDRRGGKYKYDGNSLRLSAGINYYLKNVYFSAYYKAPERGVSKDYRVMRKPCYYQLGAGWAAHGLNVSVNASNFMRSSTKGIYVEGAYDNFSEWSQDYSRYNAWGLDIRLSYSFSYGRKVKQTNSPGSTGEISSGILQ